MASGSRRTKKTAALKAWLSKYLILHSLSAH
jgi:hypothetical protein